MNHNVPIQSLIDHIKTATDVDPWAKEMVEELLKEREPRLLTREEMKNMIGESVFVEEPPNNADPRCGWAEVTEGVEPPEEGFNFPGGVDFNAESGWDTYDGDLYGLDKGCGWRAWNRRPTPEQMKAVKWE